MVEVSGDIENLDIGEALPSAGKPGLNSGAMAKMMGVV